MANEFTANWKGKVKYLYDLLTAVVTLPAGLAFPATQVSSADANTLDDYAEGANSTTLVIGDGTDNYTTTTAELTYTKTGNRVDFDITVVWTSIGSAGAGQLRISPLPFTPGKNGGATFGYIDGLDLTATLNPILLRIPSGSTNLLFHRAADNAANTALAANSSSATGEVQISGSYRV